MVCAEKLIANISLGAMAAVIVQQRGLNASCTKMSLTKTIVPNAKTECQKGVTTMPNDMTPMEALEILCKGIAPNPTANNNCIDLCKKAVSKQIPKKVIHTTDHHNHFCSTCHHPIKVGRKYCESCGQALDWRADR